jgi:hypothetical protein
MNELILSKLEVADFNANFASIGSVPRAILGDYTGLSVGTPSVGSNANTLVVNQVNLQTYTGAAALTSTLPAATAGAVVVLVITEDPAGGTATMTIDCAGSDAFRTGSCIPTTSSNKMAYDVSTAGETSIVFTPTNNTVNFLSYDSTFVFTCLDAGLWNVNVNAKADIGVTAGAATGTLLFAS